MGRLVLGLTTLLLPLRVGTTILMTDPLDPSATPTPARPPSASRFVTVVARIFTLLSACAFVVLAAETASWFTTFEPALSANGWREGEGYLSVLLPAMLAFAAAALVVSRALGRRRSWARRAFLVVLGGCLSGALARIVAHLANPPPPAAEEGPPAYRAIVHLAPVVDLVVPAAAVLVLGYLVIRFLEPGVRREFE